MKSTNRTVWLLMINWCSRRGSGVQKFQTFVKWIWHTISSRYHQNCGNMCSHVTCRYKLQYVHKQQVANGTISSIYIHIYIYVTFHMLISQDLIIARMMVSSGELSVKVGSILWAVGAWYSWHAQNPVFGRGESFSLWAENPHINLTEIFMEK